MKRRIALATIALFLGLALGADFIAADRPIAASRSGELSLLDNLGESGPMGDAVSTELRAGDWALWPLVRFGPVSVRTAGEIVVLSPPSGQHVLGTDDRGRDVFSRLVHGARTTMTLAFCVVVVSLGLGIGLAIIARLSWRPIRGALSTVFDLGSGVPVILLVVAVQGLIGGGSLVIAVAVLAIPRSADAGRIALAELDAELSKPYTAAAHALGGSRLRVLLRHALPNSMPALWVHAAITASLVVLAEAALSFLGFGAPPPLASWGELLAQAHRNGLKWWLLVPAGVSAAMLTAALATLAKPTQSR